MMQPIPSSAIDRLRARLTRLASDPRVALLPDGRKIAHEVVGTLDELDELKRRVAAIERGLAGYIQRQEDCE